ncbi:MAG: hypothetical protein C0475_03545 [Planctomyces sp.]|nr:hypothetical protein [Planctomyces sp.]MBA4039683.1 hypothetical protein [Planctomyces sp.]MBA4119549.1 hypothetical protein [Isosphaera sp.]
MNAPWRSLLLAAACSALAVVPACLPRDRERFAAETQALSAVSDARSLTYWIARDNERLRDLPLELADRRVELLDQRAALQAQIEGVESELQLARQAREQGGFSDLHEPETPEGESSIDSLQRATQRLRLAWSELLTKAKPQPFNPPGY